MVGLNLRAAGEDACPSRIAREGVLVGHRRDVDRDARVIVLPPAASHLVGALEDREVLDARLLELDAGRDPAGPGADDDHLVVRRSHPRVLLLPALALARPGLARGAVDVGSPALRVHRGERLVVADHAPQHVLDDARDERPQYRVEHAPARHRHLLGPARAAIDNRAGHVLRLDSHDPRHRDRDARGQLRVDHGREDSGEGHARSRDLRPHGRREAYHGVLARGVGGHARQLSLAKQRSHVHDVTPAAADHSRQHLAHAVGRAGHVHGHDGLWRCALPPRGTRPRA